MTVPVSFFHNFYMKVILSKLINSLGQTGNFPSSGILVINAFGAGFADLGDRSLQRRLSSSLVVCVDSSLYFLDGSLNSRSDGLIARCSDLSY